MKSLFIFLSIMLCFTGQALADIHNPVQRIERTSITGYYTDSERIEGQIVYIRDHMTRNEVSVVLTRDTGEVISKRLNGTKFTFRELIKKKLILDFSQAERLSEGDTQEIVIDLNHEVRFANPEGLEVTDVRLEDSREPHEIKIKTWFLGKDEVAKVIIKKQ